MTKEKADKVILAILDEMYEEIVRYVRKYCRDDELVKDIVQEVFLEVCRHVEELAVHECYRGWVYKTAQNKMKKMMSKDYLNAKSRVPLEDAMNELYMEDEHSFLDFDEYRHILDERQMWMLKSHYKEGKTMAQIAKETGKSEGACKMWLKRIRDLIKVHLEKGNKL